MNCVEIDVFRRHDVLQSAELGEIERQLHGVLDVRRGHVAVGLELQDRVLIFERRDLRRHLVEIGDQLDRGVAVGAHEGDGAIKRVQRLLHHLRLRFRELVEHDPARGEVRRHGGRVVEDGACFARFEDLEAQRRIDHGGVDIAGEQVRHQAAAADGHAGEIDLAVLDGPQRQQVRARAGRGDRDLLAVEILDVERRLRRHHQLPAEIAHGGVGDDLAHHALLAAGRHQRGRVEDDVGGARCHALKGLGAGAVDRQLRRDAFLLEQLLPHRGLGDRRGPVGLGRQPDADGFGLGSRGSGHECESGQHQGAAA